MRLMPFRRRFSPCHYADALPSFSRQCLRHDDAADCLHCRFRQIRHADAARGCRRHACHAAAAAAAYLPLYFRRQTSIRLIGTGRVSFTLLALPPPFCDFAG